MRTFRFRVEIKRYDENQIFFVEREARKLRDARHDVEMMIDPRLLPTAKIVRKID